MGEAFGCYMTATFTFSKQLGLFLPRVEIKSSLMAATVLASPMRDPLAPVTYA